MRKGIDVLPGDFLGDRSHQEASGEAGVFRLLGDERRGGLDGDGVKLASGSSVEEAADGLGGDADWIDVGQAGAAALNGADDLVNVDRLHETVALAHVHLWRSFSGREVGVEVREG